MPNRLRIHEQQAKIFHVQLDGMVLVEYTVSQCQLLLLHHLDGGFN